MLEIEQLILRIPGIDAREGQRLAQQVAQRLANYGPGYHQQRYIQNINLRLTPDAIADTHQLAEQIASAVINSIDSRPAAGTDVRSPAENS